jgi:uncharacterized protein YejL (UPF0352 family)
MPTFKEQIEDLLKDKSAIIEKQDTEFDLSVIDNCLNKSIDKMTEERVNLLFENAKTKCQKK